MQSNMTLSTLKKHRQSYNSEGIESGDVKVIGISEKEDQEPSDKCQGSNNRLNITKRPAPIVPSFGDMNQPSLLGLQMEELLREVRLDYAKVVGPVDAALHRLKTMIEDIEDRDPLSIAQATKLIHKLHKIVIPFPEPKPNNEAVYQLKYARPLDINVVGSYALQTMAKEDNILIIDMIVTIPEHVLEEKDYLNYRYFYKRAFYISCIAAGLEGKAVDRFDICFEYLGDNDLLPILILNPTKSFYQSELIDLSYQVRIIPAAPQDFFPASRLHPTKNAIRSKSSSEAVVNSSCPTPFYNATLRVDSNFSSYFQLLRSTLKKAPGFRDACILGGIWLRQRGFRGLVSEGGFGRFEWSVLTALLLQGGGLKSQAVLLPSYNCHQLFKAVIQYLASHDLIADPILFNAPGITFPKVAYPIFYDGLRGHNFLFKMTPWSYAMLRQEAQICIEMLSDIAFNHFEAIFIMKKNNPLQQYDSLLKLPVPKAIKGWRNIDHMSLTIRLALNVYGVLKEGLTDRVKTIQIIFPSRISWSLRALGPPLQANIFVGFIVNPAKVNRVVDHGPFAENGPDAAKFREFWGEKAELRRFKDGSISESLVWSNDSKRPVFRDIVNYMLKRHLSADIGSNIEFIDIDMSHNLPALELSRNVYNSLRAAFDILEQDLGKMGGLPIRVKHLSAIDSQLRYCSVLTPVFAPGQYLKNPAEVLVQFEGSGRWPDNLLAIQQTKVALLLKIGDLLDASVDGMVTRLGIENINRVLCNCAYLEIIYASGAAFRLRIYVDREQTLLERLLKDKTSVFYTRKEIVSAKSFFLSKCVQLPLHTQSVAMHCTRHPMLSPIIRLVKKWFQSHMLSSHIKEEVVELIVMHIFLQPYPWQAPSSITTGFWRVLQFISRWDWRTTPLIVDFSGSMSSQDVVAIHARHTAWRKIDPGMNRVVLFVASNHDTTGTVFTDERPSKVVASRMTALARSAWLMASNEKYDLEIRSVFKSSLEDYDFIIHISSQLVDGHSTGGGQQRRSKNSRLQDYEEIGNLGYDPIQLFLGELERLYSTSIVFFHNPIERALIACVWIPHTTSGSFKAGIPYSTRPVIFNNVQRGKQQVEIDKGAILSEISRLGGDLITRIEIPR